jgi:hypothetical protein
MSLPDRYFHTQLLTPDKTDRRTFRQAASVLGSTALVTALAGRAQTEALMRVVASAGIGRIARTTMESLAAADRPDPAASERIRYLVARDVADLRSTLALLDAAGDDELDAARALAGELERELRLHADAALRAMGVGDEHAPEDPELEAAGVGHPAPVRTDHAPSGLAGLSHSEASELVERMQGRDPAIRLESLQLVVDELWRLSDGERTLGQIAVVIRNEFDFRIAIEDVRTLAEALERAGCLDMGSRATPQTVQPAAG